LSFFAKLKVILYFHKNYCKTKAMAFRATETRLRDELASSIRELDVDLDNAETQQENGRIRQNFQDFETRKVTGQRLRARVRWKLVGNRMSKELFRGIREKAASSMITSLRDQDGTLVSTQAGL
jgi:hypothetical protein